MKYFPDLDDTMPWEDQEKIRRRLLFEYFSELDQLKNRISKLAYRFFKLEYPGLPPDDHESLHDARLLSFATGDGLGYVADGTTPLRPRGRRPKGSAEIRLLNLKQHAEYVFTYRGLLRVLCDKPRPAAHDVFTIEPDDFDDLDVHELTRIDDEYLRHEFQFASGASIAIDFKQLIFRRRVIKRRYSLFW